MSAISDGHYYRKQLGCENGVIAWSHRSRFKMALRLIGTAPGKVLDYGCGDGTFLAMASDVVSQGWGADIALDQVVDCRQRFDGLPNLQFLTIDDLCSPACTGTFDIVTCMETLEHCTDPMVEVVLRDLSRLVSTDGCVIISVPIEIGPTYLMKAIVRRAAAWRGLSDYRYYEAYTPHNALRMVFAGATTALHRPIHGGPDAPSHSHYGFNWRLMRAKVCAHLLVEKTYFSPLGWTGGWASSQAWFVCRPLGSVANGCLRA